jgi:hypothetical protein
LPGIYFRPENSGSFMAEMSSLRELLHPAGDVQSSLLLGQDCPAILRPPDAEMGGAPGSHAGEQADLILLAPSEAECRAESWLADAVRLMAQRLSPDGVGYMLARPRWRRKLAGLIRRNGLQVERSFGHLPDWETSAYILPFTRSAIQYALAWQLCLPRWKRLLALGWSKLPGMERLLGAFWPGAGWVVRQPRAAPIFAWLPGAGSDAVIRRSWRGPEGALILTCIDPGEPRPYAVAKVSPVLNGADPHAAEAAALEEIGACAREAGARVPEMLEKKRIGARSILLETPVSGRPAAEVGKAQPERVFPIMGQVVDWLERWHCQTAVHLPLSPADLERGLLDPAVQLMPDLQRGEAYLDWLSARCAALKGVVFPFVAAHNDLTLANLLVDPPGPVGVVDWETAQLRGWPLVDFFYAITDAVYTSGKTAGRLDAFTACFAPGGAYAPLVKRYQARLVSALSLTEEMVTLCLHACWLHHAWNERQEGQPAGSRPFLRILQWVVDHPD